MPSTFAVYVSGKKFRAGHPAPVERSRGTAAKHSDL